jgi:hypothetical protein
MAGLVDAWLVWVLALAHLVVCFGSAVGAYLFMR